MKPFLLEFPLFSSHQILVEKKKERKTKSRPVQCCMLKYITLQETYATQRSFIHGCRRQEVTPCPRTHQQACVTSLKNMCMWFKVEIYRVEFYVT